jgi:hypothetical protein
VALSRDCLQISNHDVLYSSDVIFVPGEMLPRFEKSRDVFFPDGSQRWITRQIVHPRALPMDMASTTLFLIHQHGIHFLHLSVWINILGPPRDDVTELGEPEDWGHTSN